MIDQAEAIFVGKVLAVSHTTWNQDGGEYWKDRLQLHSVELQVSRAILDTIGLGKQVTLTILGSSPLDGKADHNLKEGAQAVFFVRRTELAWRNRSRPIADGRSNGFILPAGCWGLYFGRMNERPVTPDQLIRQIAQRRKTRIQPRCDRLS